MNEKNTTARIVIDDPEIKDFESHLAGRKLCPHLLDYLKKVFALHKGGIRKINIPSTHDNVGVVLLGSSSLEETHLQIHDELHVFFNGKVVIIKWTIKGENGFCVPKGELSSLEIEKVLVEGEKVKLTLTSPRVDFPLTVDFEIYEGKSTTLEIPHPLNQRSAP
jgi:hypothetical protein